jgi:hypothetical protein
MNDFMGTVFIILGAFLTAGLGALIYDYIARHQKKAK